MSTQERELRSKLRTLEDISIVYAMRHRLEPRSQALSRFKRTLKNKFLRVHNSLWMLSLIANTMESSGFFVLNIFWEILKKRGWNREGREKWESFVFSVLNYFIGDTYKKRGCNREGRWSCESSEFFVLNSFLELLIERKWIQEWK